MYRTPLIKDKDCTLFLAIERMNTLYDWHFYFNRSRYMGGYYTFRVTDEESFEWYISLRTGYKNGDMYYYSDIKSEDETAAFSLCTNHTNCGTFVSKEDDKGYHFPHNFITGSKLAMKLKQDLPAYEIDLDQEILIQMKIIVGRELHGTFESVTSDKCKIFEKKSIGSKCIKSVKTTIKKNYKESKKSKTSKTIIILAAVIILLLVIGILLPLIIYWRFARAKKSTVSGDMSPISSDNTQGSVSTVDKKGIKPNAINLNLNKK